MTDRELREALNKGIIDTHYLLIGDEGLLIDNAVKAMKEALKVNESFDLDTFALSEIPIEEVASRLYLTPLASARRLLVIRDLEELDNRDLVSLAELIGNAKTNNCIVMIYKIAKEKRESDHAYKKIGDLMPNIKCITFTPDQQLVHKWIINKIQRDNLPLSASMIDYLEEQFKNDITGLKNEFEKIDNYLHETKNLNAVDMKDLVKGLCDFNKYTLVDEFYDGKSMVIDHFEELRPYLNSYAEIVAALTWGLIHRLRTRRSKRIFSNAAVKEIIEDIVVIDRKAKRSSYFVHLMMEIFLLTRRAFI